MTSPTKNLKYKTSKYSFIAIQKTCCMFSAFEQLFSIITWRIMRLQSGGKMAQKHMLNVGF